METKPIIEALVEKQDLVSNLRELSLAELRDTAEEIAETVYQVLGAWQCDEHVFPNGADTIILALAATLLASSSGQQAPQPERGVITPDEIRALLKNIEEAQGQLDAVCDSTGERPYASFTEQERRTEGEALRVRDQSERALEREVHRIAALALRLSAPQPAPDAALREALKALKPHEPGFGANNNDEFGTWDCNYCGASTNFGESPALLKHQEGCPVLQARAALGQVEAVKEPIKVVLTPRGRVVVLPEPQPPRAASTLQAEPSADLSNDNQNPGK